MQRKILNLIGLLVILSFFPICVFAGFTLTPKLTPPEDTESCMYNVLQKDNNWYAIKGSEIELEYDYDTTDGKQVDSLTYKILFGGITIGPITYPSDSLKVGTNKIPLPQEMVTPGTYHMSALVKYTDDTNNTIDFYVTIYKKPSIEKNGDWQSWNSENPMHIWDTQDAKLSVSCNPEELEVSYIWDKDAEGNGNSPSWEKTFSDITEKSVSKDIELTVNCVPAGLSFGAGEYLYREKFNFTYEVWKSPRESEVTLSVHVGEKVRDTLYWYRDYSDILFDQRSVSVNVPENLSGDAWNYKWICGNDTIQQAPDVDNRYFVSESLNGITGLDDFPDEGFERNLMALVTYCPDESLKPDTVETDPIVVHIFCKPKAYLSDSERYNTGNVYVIWNDSTISLQYDSSGGNGDGWFYEWSVDGVRQPDSGYSFSHAFETQGCYEVQTKGINKDPHGDIWYQSDDDVRDYTVYGKPDVRLSDEKINSYQGDNRSICLQNTDVEWKGQQSITWTQFDLMGKDPLVESSALEFTPVIKYTLEPHKTDSASCRVEVEMLPDGMDSSLTYRYEKNFMAYFWPKPSVRLYVTEGDIGKDTVNLGDKLNEDTITVRADLSECMNEDKDGWHYGWSFKDGAPLGQKETAEIKLENKTDESLPRSYEVCLDASCDFYKEGNYHCGDSLTIECLVHPLFYIDSLTVDYAGNLPEGCVETIIHENNIYSAMEGGSLVLPYHVANEVFVLEPVVVNMVDVADGSQRLLQNGKDYLLESEDKAVAIFPGVFESDHEYEFTVSVDLEKDGKAHGHVDYSVIPHIRWYEVPEIKIHNDEWNQDNTYHVWNDTVISTAVEISANSTGIWKIQDVRKEDIGRGVCKSYNFNSSEVNFPKADDVMLDSVFTVRAICYAPDGETEWYHKDLNRRFRVWMRPVADDVTSGHVFEYKDSVLHESDDTLNVCIKFSDDGDIRLYVKQKEKFGKLKWKYDWYKINDGGTDVPQSERGTDLFYSFTEGDSCSIIKYRVVVRTQPSADNDADTLLAQPVELIDTFVTKVWPVQRATINVDKRYKYYKDESGEEYMCIQNPDTVPRLDINRTGGIPVDKWLLEWFDENEKEWSGNVEMEGKSEPLWKTYHSKISVGYDNLNYYDGTVLEYNVKVYPEMSVDVFIPEQENGKYTAFYNGDTIKVQTKNDCSGIGTWNWEFEYAGHIEQSSDFDVICNLSELPEDSLIIVYNVTCDVDEDSLNLIVDNHSGRIAVKVWPLVSISNPNPEIISSIYAGQELKLKPELSDPSSSDYWTYIWTSSKADDSGYDESKSRNAIYTYCAKEDPVLPEDITYTLSASYSRDGGRAINPEPLKFTFRLYKKPVQPSYRDDMIIHRVRSGDGTVYKLDADQTSGNPEGWKFVLYVVKNGIESEVESFTKPELSTGELTFDENKRKNVSDYGPGYDEYSYIVKWYNVSPDDDTVYWDKNEIPLNRTRVYRVPYPPEELRRKGDGTSGIYIADGLELDSRFYHGLDEFLSANEYLFEFGADNDIIQQDDTRYCYYSGTGLPWVRSYWIYTDVDGEEDFYCYSDTVSLNSQQLLAPSPAAFSFDGSRFVADVAEPVRAMVSIYSSVGNMISAVSYAEDTHFEGVVNVPELSSGIYLLRFEIGEMVEERKILVK